MMEHIGSPTAPTEVHTYDFNKSSRITDYSQSNIDYMKDEVRFTIGAKFHQTLLRITFMGAN